MSQYTDIIEPLLPIPGNFDALFAFSVHKCGSTLMHKMISEVCQAEDIPSISIPDIMFHEGTMEEWQTDEELVNVLSAGRVYYGFRNLPEFMINNFALLNGKKSVLLVRDPRDALVSQFFSLGGRYVSHKLPKKNKEAFLLRLKASAHLDIDNYVLQAVGGIIKKLTDYRESLDFNNVLLRKYEDIFFEKEQFLSDIFLHFNLNVSREIVKIVAKNNDIRPEKEQRGQHIRKGFPGDHVEKLSEKTIDQLNIRLRDICEWYGYNL